MRKSPFVLAAALCAAFSLPAGALDAPKMTLGEVLRDSRAMVHGKVVDQFSQWEEVNGNKIIFTYSAIRVQNADFHLGGGPQDIAVRTVGGSIDGFRQVMIDEASFRVGEEVVVFLALEEGWDHPSVVGLNQGKYEVVRGENGAIRGLRQDPGAHVEEKEARPLISLARFSADLRQARRALSAGESTVVHPLTPVR